MTNAEIQTVRRVIALLGSMIDEPQECLVAPWHSPVRHFVGKYLCPDPHADLTCEEAWRFFQEIAQAGELQPMRKPIFLRQLPVVMEAVFRVRKCHSIERGARRLRGFKGVGLRQQA